MADDNLVQGVITITPGGPGVPTLGAGGSATAQDYFSRKAQEDAQNGPPPTGADPAPPIGLRASHQGRVISVAPDVKFVGARGQNPTPFQTYGYTDDQENYSPDVRYEGDNAMRNNSDVNKTFGGQAGTGRGAWSDTYMYKAFPRTHSTNVFVNGSPAMRHGDLFDHNGPGPGQGNTISKAQHPGPTDPKPAPKPSFWTRAWGALRVVGGAIEGVGAVGGEAVGGAADVTGVGAIVGVPINIGSAVVGANAVDNIWTGAKEVWYGTPQESLAQQGAGAIASGLGASQSTVDATKEAVGVGQGLIGGGPGGVADEASTVGREARAVDRAAEEGNAARQTEREVDEATTSGEGGVRVAKPKSKRLQFLGKTPGKNSRTGREVRERMREEGDLRTNPETGADEFKAEDGNWYPVDSPDTHMGHYPQDAVDYWNETGRQYGPQSPEVRQWMLDSNNYRFEYGPLNMSRGGSTTSRYLPPSQ